METCSDYSKMDEFFDKYMTDPKSTRIIYWADEDIVQCAKMRQKYGIRGETIEESNICYDKFKFKSYIQKANLKCAAYVHFKLASEAEIEDRIKEVEAKHSYPMFGKPTNLNTSRCTSKINNQEELRSYFLYTLGFPNLEFLIDSTWRENTIR